MIRAWIGWFVALNLLWLALIAQFVVAEEILGLFASALAASAAVALARQRLFTFRPRLRWVLPARRLPWQTVKETGWVLGALARQLAGGEASIGRFRTIPVSLPADEGEQATKRALLTAGLSFPPNSYVLEIDRERQEMLVHELVDPDRRSSG
jgi:multisubunit Na+/H+ antiporter MnhE subunit